jgi:hypothetical protein
MNNIFGFQFGVLRAGPHFKDFHAEKRPGGFPASAACFTAFKKLKHAG